MDLVWILLGILLAAANAVARRIRLRGTSIVRLTDWRIYAGAVAFFGLGGAIVIAAGVGNHSGLHAAILVGVCPKLCVTGVA